ncbi:hypothetical protein SVEN_4186 [Streptomyces venezuelae ATCC 10712]|uniref:Uncharacterized protein n=1 Tax=Streptomyces venezuelae (strain ATCC 10712 / CBS 650.69 / DSM 40230 / JCM 4526 / NBRC 13096 / PD 04745) TaxID=953739 RepID=F2RHE4_STRVP|nr:hypothetical protein vnz_20665 [Streptomyces venezuelae]QES00561.1 hypothetical protein DEJ43_20960 [Streptomyces venezuelae ATCC 10712]CCA57472.1 hypothetical protein SVEN_4186 [Streptomyces venezuelae ATCC 10712]
MAAGLPRRVVVFQALSDDECDVGEEGLARDVGDVGNEPSGVRGGTGEDSHAREGEDKSGTLPSGPRQILRPSAAS